MAEANRDETDDNRDKCAEENDDEHPEGSADAAHGFDGDKADCCATSESAKELAPADVDERVIHGCLDGVLNLGKEIDEARADNVADVNEERGDEETEVDHDDGDNDAREDAFDTVIIDAETSDLGIDDDKNENNEDNVGDFADFLPDFVDAGIVVGRDRLDDEKVVDEVIDTVDEATGGVEERTEHPRDRAGLALTDVRVFLFFAVFVP